MKTEKTSVYATKIAELGLAPQQIPYEKTVLSFVFIKSMLINLAMLLRLESRGDRLTRPAHAVVSVLVAEGRPVLGLRRFPNLTTLTRRAL